jgi:hypothetical protein
MVLCDVVTNQLLSSELAAAAAVSLAVSRAEEGTMKLVHTIIYTVKHISISSFFVFSYLYLLNVCYDSMSLDYYHGSSTHILSHIYFIVPWAHHQDVIVIQYTYNPSKPYTSVRVLYSQFFVQLDAITHKSDYY